MLMKKLVLPADSKEVQMEYHLGKIKLLESELNRLTILEHPRQIQSLCCKIMHIKRLLAKIRPDKK